MNSESRDEQGARDVDDDAVIHLRVPRDLKAKWVAASRAAGRKLSDWLIERIKAADPPVR